MMREPSAAPPPHAGEFNEIFVFARNYNVSVEDMDSLTLLHEASILNNIRTRFFNGHIYTATGPILIAVNPFKWIGALYSDAKVAEYHKSRRLDVEAPHVYRIAERAYRKL